MSIRRIKPKLKEKEIKRAAIYLRVSTRDQAREGYSIPAQKERLRAYCKAQGWTVFGEYEDAGISGRTIIKRDAFSQLLEDLDQFDAVVAYKLDRVSRSARNFLEIVDLFEAKGVRLALVVENFDSSSAAGRLALRMIADVAEFESDQIGERVYIGKSVKARSGGFQGGKAPFGYDIIDEKYIPNKDMLTAAMIYEMYSKPQSSMNEIAKKLGLSDRKINYVLSNPIYAGYHFWDGILAKGDHKHPIIVDIWNKVQRKRKMMRRGRSKGGIFTIREEDCSIKQI